MPSRNFPQNTTHLLCQRPRDGPGRWERLIDHVSLIKNYTIATTLIAGTNSCYILLEREGAFAAFRQGLIPEKVRARLKHSEWIQGAWIVSETFPSENVKIYTPPKIYMPS
ncbi:protein UL145 [Aotine betaherpesvirus 1]|uniref:Protein UL145 n=1 Tax=Aotine betaherpesvirus 1 TaxID=50290 RepID=G8XUJ8_9BETA|nr:protein UL145 [Aotine betaherpesvirus 1]AEV80839.1 protein UL145 [Aotine betaherpesvirus 1]